MLKRTLAVASVIALLLGICIAALNVHPVSTILAIVLAVVALCVLCLLEHPRALG